jgi:CRP/FNR family cyclic AMP-dependent transcriptional regulator
MDLQGLCAHLDTVQTFPAHATICAAGTPGEVMYGVGEGEVELRVHGAVLAGAGPGAMVGERALIAATPRRATARARSACRLAPVDERRLLSLVHAHPFFALHVMRVLADRLRHMHSAWQPPQRLEPPQ